MSVTTYESTIKTISSNEEVVFAVLSDLSNIEKFKEKLPADKVKDMQFDSDSISFAVDGLGKVAFRIIEREPSKTIKFESEKLPITINMWVQLKQVAEKDTRMKLTFKADIPTMIKVMVDSKLKTGIEKAAELLAMIPYDLIK